MSHVGEVRESDIINLMHSGLRIRLTARRQGTSSLWSIWRSDTGQTVPNCPDIETRWVDLNSTYWPKVRVLWNGNNFRITLDNGQPYIQDTHVLNYIGHDMREAWQCYWNPANPANPFHHTCIRIASTAPLISE
jgi:hypothetical protein